MNSNDSVNSIGEITLIRIIEELIFEKTGRKLIEKDLKGKNTKERKKEAAASARARAHARKANEIKPPAAAINPPTRDLWFNEYEQQWGMLVGSAAEADEIMEWKKRITIEGWRYSLKEARDANARRWSYLRKVLQRVERDGLPINGNMSPTSTPTTVDIVWNEITQ